MEINEGNLIIAKFMGDKEYVHKAHFKHWMREEAELIGIEDLQFHSSWDWLMPVVEKIRDLGSIDIVISIKRSVFISWDDGTAYFKQTLGNGRNSIETTYEAVIEFIKWYNETKEDRT